MKARLFNLEIWKQAQIAADYVKKGSLVELQEVLRSIFGKIKIQEKIDINQLLE